MAGFTSFSLVNNIMSVCIHACVCVYIYHIIFMDSSIDGHLSCSLDYCKYCCNKWECMYFIYLIFIFFGYICRSRTAGSYSRSIFYFLRKFHFVFDKYGTNLHSDCQCKNIHFYSHSHQHFSWWWIF